ncbi:hypothetical protein CCR75_004861 [Bremia lactucae]|uniref:Uncharacterized protein n=1 Tax=Bremia lactucae TaxID=4779 RepID=A0A976IGA0_BRELC|nr:hypothetical protein CCR75_004861 [Bremia lactucae]
MMHRNHISNFEQAQSAYKLIQDWNGVPVSKFAEFDKAVMGGFKKAGMNEAEASEVVVKVLTEEIGNLGAARLLNDLQKGNPELFARTQSSLYQYWNKIQLSYSSFHDGKISMGMSESPYHIQDVILDTFSEYFKYAKQVPGSEDDSAYKSMMKDLESKGYGGFVDNIIRTFSPPSEFKPANDATRIALEYLKKQHVKYNTPSAIIKAVPFEEKSLNVLGNPFYRLSALCKSKVEVEVGAVDEVKKQAKWLIKELDDWVFDKKFFLIMYPLREKEELAASVLEQLSFRWKKDEALSKALESDLKKSIPQIPAGKLRWSMTEPDAPLNYFRDLAFEKPILASK